MRGETVLAALRQQVPAPDSDEIEPDKKQKPRKKRKRKKQETSEIEETCTESSGNDLDGDEKCASNPSEAVDEELQYVKEPSDNMLPPMSDASEEAVAENLQGVYGKISWDSWRHLQAIEDDDEKCETNLFAAKLPTTIDPPSLAAADEDLGGDGGEKVPWWMTSCLPWREGELLAGAERKEFGIAARMSEPRGLLGRVELQQSELGEPSAPWSNRASKS